MVRSPGGYSRNFLSIKESFLTQLIQIILTGGLSQSFIYQGIISN